MKAWRPGTPRQDRRYARKTWAMSQISCMDSAEGGSKVRANHTGALLIVARITTKFTGPSDALHAFDSVISGVKNQWKCAHQSGSLEVATVTVRAPHFLQRFTDGLQTEESPPRILRYGFESMLDPHTSLSYQRVNEKWAPKLGSLIAVPTRDPQSLRSFL